MKRVINASYDMYDIPEDVYYLIIRGYDLYQQFYMLDDEDAINTLIDNTCNWYRRGEITKQDIEDWVWGLEADLNKSQQEREDEAAERLSKYDEYLADEAYDEMKSMRNERDEWNEYWDSRGVY